VKASLWTDGGARGNPGPAAYGFVLESDVGTVLAEEKQTIGTATNNVAEYSGLVAGLSKARELNVRELEVVSDSELMVKQMRGEYRVRSETLRELYDEATALARQIGKVEYRHVLRAENSRADGLVNEVLDGASASTISHPFGRAVEAGDEDAALATIADDVEFRSPAVYKPYHGKEQVGGILRLVATVFENFRYTNEWRDGRTTILFFEANVGDRELQGIDILEENDDREIQRLTVMIRPLSGLQAVAGAMSARLGLA
jgi:ribonuclease HI